MNILVLAGGMSSERAISLRSAESVVSALNSAGHSVYRYDTAGGLNGIANYKHKVDVVFPILHGKDGEDGVVQAMLEKLELKYLGADARVSRLCFDKVAFKNALVNLGIATPKWELVTQKTINLSPLLSKPFVLKPNDGGSSIDTFIVRQPNSNNTEYKDVFSRHSEMLLEELIEGVEITIPVLGDKALSVVEIIPPLGAEFDYENKYNGKTMELCPPKNVSSHIQIQAQKISEQIHQSLGVRHISRTDIIVDKHSQLYVLELNTIPGLTDQSLLPKSAQAAGISMPEMVQKLVYMVSGSTS